MGDKHLVPSAYSESFYCVRKPLFFIAGRKSRPERTYARTIRYIVCLLFGRGQSPTGCHAVSLPSLEAHTAWKTLLTYIHCVCLWMTRLTVTWTRGSPHKSTADYIPLAIAKRILVSLLVSKDATSHVPDRLKHAVLTSLDQIMHHFELLLTNACNMNASYIGWETSQRFIL